MITLEYNPKFNPSASNSEVNNHLNSPSKSIAPETPIYKIPTSAIYQENDENFDDSISEMGIPRLQNSESMLKTSNNTSENLLSEVGKESKVGISIPNSKIDTFAKNIPILTFEDCSGTVTVSKIQNQISVVDDILSNIIAKGEVVIYFTNGMTQTMAIYVILTDD